MARTSRSTLWDVQFAALRGSCCCSMRPGGSVWVLHKVHMGVILFVRYCNSRIIFYRHPSWSYHDELDSVMCIEPGVRIFAHIVNGTFCMSASCIDSALAPSLTSDYVCAAMLTWVVDFCTCMCCRFRALRLRRTCCHGLSCIDCTSSPETLSSSFIVLSVSSNFSFFRL